jgi:hypothetical protein
VRVAILVVKVKNGAQIGVESRVKMANISHFLVCVILAMYSFSLVSGAGDIFLFSEKLLYENDCRSPSLVVSASGGMGLCNQINLIAYGMELARLTGRNLCVYGFRPQFHRFHEVPIEDVIDINATNAKLHALPAELGYGKVRISGFFNEGNYLKEHRKSVCLLSSHTKDAPPGPKRCKYSGDSTITIPVDEVGRNNLVDFLKSDRVRPIPGIHLSPGVPNEYDFFGHMKEVSHDRLAHLYRSIVYAPYLYDISKKLMKSMGVSPRNFTAVHMRLENDFITSIWNGQDVDSDRIPLDALHDVLANDFVSFLLQHTSVRDKIFIVTGLSLNRNTLNGIPYFMERLFNESKFQFHDKVYLGLPNYRELHAIVDAIVATQASSFIGVDAKRSTFSRYISWALPTSAPTFLMPVNYTKAATDLRLSLTKAKLASLHERIHSNEYYDLLRQQNLDGTQNVTNTNMLPD